MARLNKRRSRSRVTKTAKTPARNVRYNSLKNPLIRQPVFSDDRVTTIHQTALRVLQELGIRVLNDEARNRFKEAGASVNEETRMVYIDREMVEKERARESVR